MQRSVGNKIKVFPFIDWSITSNGIKEKISVDKKLAFSLLSYRDATVIKNRDGNVVFSFRGKMLKDYSKILGKHGRNNKYLKKIELIPRVQN